MPAQRPVIRAAVPHQDAMELFQEGWTLDAVGSKAVEDKLAQRPAQPGGDGPILWTMTNPGHPEATVTFYQRQKGE